MQSVPYPSSQTQVRVNSFIRSVYNWMGIALALTGFTAFYVANSPQILNLLFNVAGNRLQPTMLFWGCLIGELVMVFILSARVQMIDPADPTTYSGGVGAHAQQFCVPLSALVSMVYAHFGVKQVSSGQSYLSGRGLVNSGGRSPSEHIVGGAPPRREVPLV